MTLLCLLVVYYVIWSLLFLRSDIVSPAQKQSHVTIVIVSLTLVVPLLVFEVIKTFIIMTGKKRLVWSSLLLTS